MMDQIEQEQFVNDLTDNIRKDVVRKIMSGAIPATWDGHELRLYLGMKFADEAQMRAAKNQRTKRGKDFINTVRVNNL